MTALSDLRVLDLTDIKGALCAKLFGDMGADVIKIEPPGGDHPQRLDAVEKEIIDLGFSCVRRTMLKANSKAALSEIPEDRRNQAVVLVDTMGELKRFFAAADAAFVGGSLIPHGGQNVMEPAGMGLSTGYRAPGPARVSSPLRYPESSGRE